MASAAGGNGANGPPSVTSSPSTSPSTLRTLESVLLNRLQFALDHDFEYSYDGKRDIFQALGYKSKLQFKDYWTRYRRGGLTRTIVDFFPKHCWVDGAAIYDNPDPDIVTPFESAVEELFERLDFWHNIFRVDKLAGIGRYSLLFVGIVDNLDFSVPAPKKLSSVAISDLYLTPVAEGFSKIEKYDEDPNSKNFGKPEMYQIQFGENNKQSRKVHASRVFHIARFPLENSNFGDPALQAVWNLFDDLYKVTGGGSESAWLRANPGMNLKLDPAYKSAPGELVKLTEEVDEYLHGQRRILKTRGVDVETLSTNPFVFSTNAGALLEQIAGTARIPFRELIGSERGELSSEQDKVAKDTEVGIYRKLHATPLLRTIIDRFVSWGVLPEPQQKYIVEWPTEEELTEEQKADAVEKYAKANKAQTDAGDTVVMTSNEMRDRLLGLDPLEEQVGVGEEESGEEEDDSDSEDEDLEELLAASDSASSDEPEWRTVHRAAESHRRLLARLIVNNWIDTARSLDESTLVSAFESGDSFKVETEVFSAYRLHEASLSNVLPARLLSVLVDGGLAVTRSARARGSWRVAAQMVADSSSVRNLALSFDFNVVNQRAVAWSALRSASLVREIGADTEAVLRQCIAQSIQTGIAPKESARRIRDMVGLRSRDLTAVDNLRARLESAKPGSLVKAGRTKIRIPKSGVTQSLIETRTSQYAERLRNQRALLIGRTETLRAANAGQKEAWQQAIDAGQLPKEQKRIWLHNTDRHADMAGQVVGVDESFTPPIEPGQEPNCGCAQGLV